MSNLSVCFNDAFAIPEIIKYWDTSNITDMSGAFYRCENYLNLSVIADWDVSNVNWFGYMFEGADISPDLLELRKWNVSKGENFSEMFASTYVENGEKLTSIWGMSERDAYESSLRRINVIPK